MNRSLRWLAPSFLRHLPLCMFWHPHWPHWLKASTGDESPNPTRGTSRADSASDRPAPIEAHRRCPRPGRVWKRRVRHGAQVKDVGQGVETNQRCSDWIG